MRADARTTGELRRLLKRAKALAESGTANWDAIMQADQQIHLALARIGGTPLHHFFLETVHNNLHRYHIITYLPRTEKTIRTTVAELQEIVDAVARGDAGRAETLARDHVGRATAAMKKKAPTRPPAPALSPVKIP